jgi:hypothetical protein
MTSDAPETAGHASCAAFWSAIFTADGVGDLPDRRAYGMADPATAAAWEAAGQAGFAFLAAEVRKAISDRITAWQAIVTELNAGAAHFRRVGWLSSAEDAKGKAQAWCKAIDGLGELLALTEAAGPDGTAALDPGVLARWLARDRAGALAAIKGLDGKQLEDLYHQAQPVAEACKEALIERRS